MNRTTAANHIYRLSSEKHLFDIVDLSQFNIYDYHRRVFHIRSFETEFMQKVLFQTITDASQNREYIVIYHLADCETACLTIFDGEDRTLKEIEVHIYGTALIRAIESLYGVTITSKFQRLQPINSRSFVAKWGHMAKKWPALNFYHNYIAFDSDNCKLHAETAEAYEKGIAHLKFLDGISQEYAWQDEEGVPNNGKAYKHLYFEEDTVISLILDRMDGGRLDRDFMFFLSYDEALVNNKHSLTAENRALLQRLMPACRKHRLRGILEVV
ncbi:hypothetical protein [Pontibacter chinhatensis]|uniref:Uncharacterized protein n=1 Tax=Pontibacter chinhatensis TaxID=1436961 RepID=A0A1I2ZSN5_9BACT|nr:hypothetical protein [Pontibacter chinhatensis]SFH40892.1 hypothetical protein SAMN05421739_11828 [Pontibacter chinhatensis]